MSLLALAITRCDDRTRIGLSFAYTSMSTPSATRLYRAGEGTGLIGITVGAVIILFIWKRLVTSEVIRDRGLPP